MKNNGHIVLISYLDFPYFEGASKRLEGIIRSLKLGGMQIEVICPLLRRNLPDLEYKEFVNYVDLRMLKSLNVSKGGKIILNIIFSILAAKMLIRFSIKTKIVIQYQDMYSSIPAVFIKLLLGGKIIGDDIVPLYFDEGRRHPSLVRIFHLLDLTILRLTDIIVTASPKAYTFIRTSLKEKSLLFFPNGITTSKEKQSVPKDVTKERKKLIIFVGTLSFDQNIQAIKNMFKVTRKLLEKRTDFEMLVVGGPLQFASNMLNDNLVKDRIIRFTGYVSNKELESIYQQAFVGLLPFFQETPLCGGQRTKALEYFSRGLLVVTGPEGINGIRNLKIGEDCLLALSIDEMSELLYKILSNPIDYDRISANGLNFVNSAYSWEVLSKDYVKSVKDIYK